MTKRRGPITAAELTAQLESDPEYLARKRERDVALAARVARLREEQAPIVGDLQAAGISVNLLSDLLTRSVPYPRAIPVLLKHLGLSYSDPTLETLARSLAVPDARHAWPVLVTEYRKAPSTYENGIRSGVKDGLAVALAATVTGATMDELIALAKDRSHGASRLLLLRALRKSRSAAAKQAIAELSMDPDLEKEIASWRGRSVRRPPPSKSDRFH